MALFVRELKEWEARKLQHALRRSNSHTAIVRSQVVLASAQGFKVPAIAKLSREGFFVEHSQRLRF
jgi:hypothetical protein